MEMTLGTRIGLLRREKGLKQEELAECMGVSPQAVSKWENDLNCPDIALLPLLAKTLGVTVDHLLTGEKQEPPVRMVPEGERKDFRDMFLRVTINSNAGDKLRMNLPMSLVKVALDTGVSITGNDAFSQIDLQQIVTLVSQGAVGNLVEIESADGDTVRVFVE